VVDALSCVRRNSSELWNQLLKATFHAILDNLPNEISLKTVAFWIGRIMRGIGQAAPDVVLSGVIPHSPDDALS
jgi:hypothetical protein